MNRPHATKNESDPTSSDPTSTSETCEEKDGTLHVTGTTPVKGGFAPETESCATGDDDANQDPQDEVTHRIKITRP